MSAELTYQIIGAAIEVHKTLGPGLLESVYKEAMIEELTSRGLEARTEVPFTITYKGKDLSTRLRLDLLVCDTVIVELKSVQDFQPVHFKQLLTYLKVTGLHIGLLINFNVADLKHNGLKRIVNDYHPDALP